MIRSLTGNIIQLKLRICAKRLISVAIILLLLTDGIHGLSLLGRTSDVCRKCNLENEVLAKVYQQQVIDDVRRTCVYVKEFLRCAAPLESKCREDLNFQGALTLMRSFREEQKCASMNITVNEIFKIMNPKSGNFTDEVHTTPEKKCKRPNFKSVYKICGLFGDPHLRTFSDKRNTCSVPGAWPLFANRYLTVQVTNIPLENSSRATATSKVTVIVRGFKRKCIEEKTYQARSFSLPTHFSDGTKSSGDKECPTTVTQLKNGRRIMIDICHLKTKIIIRQVGKYLTVHMRVPKDLTRRKSIGLCQRGCPRIEQMNLEKMTEIEQVIDSFYKKDKLSKRVRREREERARKLCGKANIKGFYYKSCLFDMLTSDDKTFVKAARKAMKDFRTINKDDEGRPIVNETARDYPSKPRTEPKTTEPTSIGVPSVIPSSSAYTVHKSSFSLLLALLVMLLVFR